MNVSVNSIFEGLIGRDGKPIELKNGFLPFQWEGLEHMENCERSVYYQWTTGTGKALAAEGTILWHKKLGFDLCFYVVKVNNLTDAARKLETHTGLTGRLLRGSRDRRDRILAETDIEAEEGLQPILIFNAEKFREDKDILKMLVEGRNLLVLFDEMPDKYSNRKTALYRATAEVLYTSHNTLYKGTKREKKVFYPSNRIRAASMFCAAMSGTPIIRSPEGVYNSIRMMDPDLVGSPTDFNNCYVARRDRFRNITAWHNLEHFRDRIAPIVHIADRDKDERIRAQFPLMMPREIAYCDLDSSSERLYNILQKEYGNRGDASILSYDEILSAIACFQMICSNPQSVLLSAGIREEYEFAMAEFMKTNPSTKDIKLFKKKYMEGSAVALKLRNLVNNDSLFSDSDKKGNCTVSKMVELRDRIERHGDKVLVFTSMNDTLLPLISGWFDAWGLSHVVYHGGLVSARSKQEVLDNFRHDPNIQVFLSSDAGSTSIDLPQASLKIDYDLPWSWAALKQRDRHDRIDSMKDVIYNVTLAVPGTIEDRKAEIIDEKHQFHQTIFGSDDVDDFEVPLARNGLLYILTGEYEDEA